MPISKRRRQLQEEAVHEGELVVVMRLRVADPTVALEGERDSLRSEQIDMLWQAHAEEVQARYASICGDLPALSFRIESWSEYREEEETKLFYELVAETTTLMLADAEWREEFAWRIFSAEAPHFIHDDIPGVFDPGKRVAEEEPASQEPSKQQATQVA